MTASPPGAAPAATIGRRVGAFAIDIAVAWVIGAVLVGVVLGILFGVGPAWERDGLAVMILLSYVGIVLLLLVWWLVYSAMQGGRGGSIGQRILGLRLHDAASAGPIGFWRAILRNLVFSLATSIVVGYFTPLLDASGRRQGWHDMTARAVVVDIRNTDAAPRRPRRRPPRTRTSRRRRTPHHCRRRHRRGPRPRCPRRDSCPRQARPRRVRPARCRPE